MSKYGEPLEALNGGIYDSQGRFIVDCLDDDSLANRIALCGSACAGMSDEDVRKTGEIMHNFLHFHDANMSSLKSQLDEAVGLLEHASSNAKARAAFDFADKIDNFLTRHKDQS